MVDPQKGVPVTRQRRWRVVAIATVLYQFSYVPTVWLVGAEVEGTTVPDSALALAIAIVPVVLIVIAFGSNHAGAPVAVLRGMVLFLAAGLLVGLLHILPGLVAGYGAGAASVLRSEFGRAVVWPRIAAVALTTVLVVLFLGLVPIVALVLGAGLPFVALAVADERTERRLGAAGGV